MVDITKNLLGFTSVICKYALLHTGVLRVNIKDAVKCNALFFSLTLLHELTFSWVTIFWSKQNIALFEKTYKDVVLDVTEIMNAFNFHFYSPTTYTSKFKLYKRQNYSKLKQTPRYFWLTQKNVLLFLQISRKTATTKTTTAAKTNPVK